MQITELNCILLIFYNGNHNETTRIVIFTIEMLSSRMPSSCKNGRIISQKVTPGKRTYDRIWPGLEYKPATSRFLACQNAASTPSTAFGRKCKARLLRGSGIWKCNGISRRHAERGRPFVREHRSVGRAVSAYKTRKNCENRLSLKSPTGRRPHEGM